MENWALIGMNKHTEEEALVAKCIDEVKNQYIEWYNAGYQTCLENTKEVQFWYVKGVPQTLYDNKLRAERAARLAFPDEDADKRYSRVFFKTFYEEV